MRLSLFTFGATTAFYFFQQITARPIDIIQNAGATSINYQVTSTKRDGLAGSLLQEVLGLLTKNGIGLTDGELLNLNEGNLIKELLGFLGIGDGTSNSGVLGGNGSDAVDDDTQVLKEIFGDGDDDEGDKDTREDDTSDLIGAIQKLLCSKGIAFDFVNKDNILLKSEGSCTKDDSHEDELISNVLALIKNLLIEVGIDKNGSVLCNVLKTVTKLASCLLQNLVGGAGGII
ncbi:hypothetical protein BJ944DRAFT_272945 [Cunninghamella echinulata]|nr:hypothetical protein BJ944DRAFT_272945 [Cunninghamella echinulata]